MNLLITVCLLGGAIPEVPLTTRGSWVFDEKGQAAAPALWMRGLQTSDLSVCGNSLISVGDQRSNFPGYIFIIAPPTATPPGAPTAPTKLTRAPVGIVPDPTLSGPVLQRYLQKRNPDFEGLAHDPFRTNVFYGVIEMDGPFLLEIHWSPGSAQATIKRIVTVTVSGLDSWRRHPNYRFEGIAVVGPGPELVIAYERALDELPRLLHVTWPLTHRENTLSATVMPIAFQEVPKRPGKGLLNVNGIAAVFTSSPKTVHLLLIARDQERILVVDATAQKIVRIVTVDFRGPDGEKLKWVSPEGIAADPTAGRVYTISDPDSISGNYRKLDDAEAQDNYGKMVPLLFTLPLGAIVPEAAAKAGN